MKQPSSLQKPDIHEVRNSSCVALVLWFYAISSGNFYSPLYYFFSGNV